MVSCPRIEGTPVGRYSYDLVWHGPPRLCYTTVHEERSAVFGRQTATAGELRTARSTAEQVVSKALLFRVQDAVQLFDKRLEFVGILFLGN